MKEDAIARMRRGHRAAAERQRVLLRAEGPKPDQAVAEALSAVAALASQGAFPAPRDPVSERGVDGVRRRWVRIAKNARKSQRQ